jgi:limonene-1,2-epoxide hydrolase
MKKQLILIVIIIGLMLSGCGTAAPQDPTAVVQAYYAAINEGNVDKAMTYIADEAVFVIPPFAKYTGREDIKAYLTRLTGGQQKVKFELSNFSADGGRVTYSFVIYQGSEQFASGDDGLTIVENGKITFDGSVATGPK